MEFEDRMDFLRSAGEFAAFQNDFLRMNERSRRDEARMDAYCREVREDSKRDFVRLPDGSYLLRECLLEDDYAVETLFYEKRHGRGSAYEARYGPGDRRRDENVILRRQAAKLRDIMSSNYETRNAR